jgi:prepilin-type N-terminal cleavage/methylation domain-containing protein
MKNRRLGFTLVELLVVIAIIAVLAAILFPVFAAVKRKARIAADMANLNQIATAVKTYHQDHDAYPPSLYALDIDLTAPADLSKQDFSYQEDGFGNVLYNYYGYQPNGIAAPPDMYYTGAPGTAQGGAWPPAVGGAGWEAYDITNWRKFPMLANKVAPSFTIITWSPYNRVSIDDGDPPYDEGPILIVRLDGSAKTYADEPAENWFQDDPATGLTPFQHQTLR